MIKDLERRIGEIRRDPDPVVRAKPGDLHNFTLTTFPEYQTNWHHKIWFQKLDDFVSGNIKRLMVFAPPRHGKSEIVSRRLPAYILGRNPDHRIIACSHTATFAQKINRDVQRIINSREYRECYPSTRIGSERGYVCNSEIFETIEKKGFYKCAGVGGAITGEGFDFGIIDDPIKNQEQALSIVYRDKVFDWYTSTFFTRQAPNARILITLTRWHVDDLAGRLLKRQEECRDSVPWEVLRFPAMREPDDPEDGREVGEPLWPEWFGRDFLEDARITLGSYQFAAIYGQRPIPLGGGLFQAHWFGRYRKNDASWITPDMAIHLPDICRRFTVVDPAVGRKKNSGDHTAIGAFAATRDNRLLVLDVFRDRVPLENLAREIQRLHVSNGCDYVCVEANGFQISLVSELRRMGLPVREMEPRGKSKVVRAMPAIARAESGQILIPEGEAWQLGFLRELAEWTGVDGDIDDQVDMLSYAVEEAFVINMESGSYL